MSRIEARIAAMGLVLPQPLQAPAGLSFPFEWVRVRGRRAFVSGHIPLQADGRIAAPLGRVGAEVSPEQGHGDLDRITAWLRVFAMVNVAPGFYETPRVTNGYSDLILELFGPEVGAHARSSIGMVIPLNAPVNCEAEVEIDGGEH
jgi:hypothetical protein